MKGMAIPVLIATLGAISPPVLAQGESMRSAGAGTYDPRTVEVFSGEVVSVEHVPVEKGRSGGVHLLLKTDGQTVPIHLGPAWYVDKQTVRVGRGDHVEVEGSRVSFEGKPVIIARQVKKDGQTLTLRNEAGVSAWAGRRVRRQSQS